MATWELQWFQSNPPLREEQKLPWFILWGFRSSRSKLTWEMVQRKLVIAFFFFFGLLGCHFVKGEAPSQNPNTATTGNGPFMQLINRIGHTLLWVNLLYFHSGKKRYFSCSFLPVMQCNKASIGEHKAYWHMNFLLIDGCDSIQWHTQRQCLWSFFL